MSHVDLMKCEVKSLNALTKAVERLGGEFREGQKKFKWFGRSVGDYPLPTGYTSRDMGHCEHALHFANCDYEVGVVPDKEKDGQWQLMADFWSSGGLSRVIGDKGWKLNQALVMEQSQEAARCRGKAYQEIQMDDRVRTIVFV
jgi:hypothetical protein